ncbi:hypothetical protein FNL55_15780 [Tardiphaga sp. vice352]|uniref:hypothetical protein n=1 Tax=Tardiphaga sp. vice352 TaxID=2592816 RepID=UPI001162614E|nr:hypothetical protein [Tardiphaga sp. vice352]QDM32647.1 hypothetical protein FNL55_15780 [Tardiphaga sp. vice352]
MLTYFPFGKNELKTLPQPCIVSIRLGCLVVVLVPVALICEVPFAVAVEFPFWLVDPVAVPPSPAMGRPI